MLAIQNIVEYYDELFPVTTVQKKFYDQLVKNYSVPVKFLRIGCGTGMFESILAREGYDVTGIESNQELLRSANMRRRSQLMAIRFFQMSYKDMTRFLGKGFYNIISILDSRISFIRDKESMQQFFCDVNSLLSDGGCFVIDVLNFANMKLRPLQNLPERKSVRASLYTEMWTKDEAMPYISGSEFFLTQNLETGNGRLVPIMEEEPICAVTIEDIKAMAKKSGFSEVNLYSGFSGESFTGKEERLVVVIKK